MNWSSSKILVSEQLSPFRRDLGHGGGDIRLKDKLFLDPNQPDPWRQSAGSRDGAMSCLIGIAARNSIEQKKPIRIQDLTSIPLQETGRGV